MKEVTDREILSSRMSSLKDLPEIEVQKMIALHLSKYFRVELEVVSTDGNSRIDIVSIHKSDTERAYPIGIEVKPVTRKKGTEIGRWILQAKRYTEAEFKGYGKVAVFLFPQLSGLYLDEGTEVHRHNLIGHGIENGPHHIASTMLSCFDLGELQLYKSWKGAWSMRLAYAAKRIWEEHNDKFEPYNLTQLKKAA